MKLVYPVKIMYKDGSVVSLVSPHLRTDLITRYIGLISESLPNDSILTTGNIDVNSLQIVIEDYIRWIQSNNYVLRLPKHSQIDSQQNGQWINVQLNIPVEEGAFERLGKIVSILIFLTTAALGEFFFILAARLNKVSYTTIILPILVDFTMEGIIYAYSGTVSNIATKGKELDDWWTNKKLSPTEIEFEKEHSFCSSWTLSRFILCILPLSCTIFQFIGYWQSMMSMSDEVKSAHLNDPIITPKFIYTIAIIGTTIGTMNSVMVYTSITLQASSYLKKKLDKYYYICSKKLSYNSNENYAKILTANEDVESGVEIKKTDTGVAFLLSSSFDIGEQTERDDKKSIQTHTVFFIKEIVYDNLLIRQDLLHEARQIGGIKAVQNIINLGKDAEVASLISEYIEQYGAKHIVNILFNYAIQSYKIEVDLSNSQIKDIMEDTQQNSKISSLLNAKEIDDQIIENNFFLNNEKGKDFIQVIANHFDKKILLSILELGRDQEVAEQVLSEIEIEGIDKVINIFFGNIEVPITVVNLENIIGTQEFNQLALVPNGIFNIWSNKVYLKVVEYIDSLAKNLDDLLNIGKFGNQITITIMVLEELLKFATSDHKFVGGRPPYYNPGDDEWSYSNGGNSDGSNNTAENFDNQSGFVLLTLPAYNGTDYDTNHQI